MKDFKQKVSAFKAENGNSKYSERDMLMYLCKKCDNLEDSIGNVKIDIAEVKGKFELGANKITWLRRIQYATFTCLTGLLYLVLHFHGII